MSPVQPLPLPVSTAVAAVAPSLPALIVFSHLRWGFVYQRPQHLMSRLAGRWRVFFVEEPVRADGPAHLKCSQHADNLTVVVPHTPVAAPGFHDDQLALLEPLVTDYLQQQGVERPACWLYTPMALPLVKAVQPRCVVYDCMDELAAFKDAPRQLRQRETALMKRAAVVFAGGPSLYDAKKDLHANAHCIPSSVDAAHFAPSNLQPGSALQREADALQGGLSRPRLGFFGVVDERLDVALVGRLAEAHPDWQIVMAGPVVKIDRASLPQRPNLHWLGMQRYELLPYLLAGWDVCLIPFAINASTRFISPTKTLEYMAGGKPVVSTAIRDVERLYGEAVRIADDADAFVRACEDTLAESAAARSERALAARATLAVNSWDRSADRIHALLSAAWRDAAPLLTPVETEPLPLAASSRSGAAATAAASNQAAKPIAAAAGSRA